MEEPGGAAEPRMGALHDPPARYFYIVSKQSSPTLFMTDLIITGINIEYLSGSDQDAIYISYCQ